MRGGRHGPRRHLLAGADTMAAFGVLDPAERPVRGRHGEFLVAGPLPALAQGSVLVGDVAAASGTVVALPGVYVAHLEGCLHRIAAAATARDVRTMPWPYRSLSAAVDDAHRRVDGEWEPLGRLDDDEPLWTGWADALVHRDGFRVAAPWLPGQGALGYGRWLPAALVEHARVRDDGLRVMDIEADRFLAALTWHGVAARRDDDRVAAALVGWTAMLPATVASSAVVMPVEPVTVLVDDLDHDVTLAGDRG